MLSGLADYHIHTLLCKHAEGEFEDYIEYALRTGLMEIGFSDHLPLPNNIDYKHRMHQNQLKNKYLDRLIKLKDEYKDKITIKIGGEADYYPGTERYIEKIIKKYPFDYIIGSVHFLNDWAFDCNKDMNRFHKKNLRGIYTAYFKQISNMVKTGLFDIIGHFDLIKKFGFKPQNGYADIVSGILADIKVSKMAVEINTAGLRKPVNEIYPSKDIILMLSEYNIPFTLGSDAHKPEQVGYDFAGLKNFLDENNISNVVKFEKRKII